MNGKVLYFLDCISDKKEFSDFLLSCDVIPVSDRHWDLYEIYYSPSGLGEFNDPLIQQFEKVKDYIRYNVWELTFQNKEDYLMSVIKFPEAIYFIDIPPVFSYVHRILGLGDGIGKPTTVYSELAKYPVNGKFKF